LKHRKNTGPGRDSEDKKQISFADTGPHQGKKGSFDYAYNAQISVDADCKSSSANISAKTPTKTRIEPALKALQDTAGRCRRN